MSRGTRGILRGKAGRGQKKRAIPRNAGALPETARISTSKPRATRIPSSPYAASPNQRLALGRQAAGSSIVWEKWASHSRRTPARAAICAAWEKVMWPRAAASGA